MARQTLPADDPQPQPPRLGDRLLIAVLPPVIAAYVRIVARTTSIATHNLSVRLGTAV